MIAYNDNLSYHMAKFEDIATQHYRTSSNSYHNNLVRAPALFLCSLDDSVGSVDGIRRVADKWGSIGMDVSWSDNVLVGK
jgi:hypothetical protein